MPPSPRCLILFPFFLALEMGQLPSACPLSRLCSLAGRLPKQRADLQGWLRAISVAVAATKREVLVLPLKEPCSVSCWCPCRDFS